MIKDLDPGFGFRIEAFALPSRQLKRHNSSNLRCFRKSKVFALMVTATRAQTGNVSRHGRETGTERQLKDTPHPKPWQSELWQHLALIRKRPAWREPPGPRLPRNCKAWAFLFIRIRSVIFSDGPRKQSFRAVSRKVWRQRLHEKWW